MLVAAVIAQGGISVIDQGWPTLAGFLKSDLGLSAGAAGFAVSTFVLGRIFASYAAGVATDRFGERPVLVLGTLLAGALFILAATAGVPLVFVLTTLAGAASATATPAGGRLILATFPPRQHGLALGIRQTGVPLGGLIGAATLPWIAHAWGWRWSLVIAGAVAAATAVPVALWRGLREAERRGDIAHAAPGQRPWRDRNIRLLMLWGTLFSSGQYAMLAYLALDLRQHQGFSLTTGSLFVAVAQAGGLVARIVWGAASDRLRTHGRRPLLFAVNACAVLGILGLALMPRSAPTALLVIVVLIAGLGAMGFQGLFMLVLAEASGANRVGAATGFAVMGMQTATVIGVPFYGFVSDAAGDYRAVWITLSLILTLACVPIALLQEAPR